MIKVTNEENTVKISVFLSTVNWTVSFSQKRTEEFDAVLLRKEVQDCLSEEIRKIKQKYYDLGWNEKTSKKCKKRTYFSGLF